MQKNSKDAGRRMIRCINVCKSYPMGKGKKQVLRNVNMTIRNGQKIGLLGGNGAGKSTLIKLIGGVEMPTSGCIQRKMTVSWPLGFGGGFQGSLTGYDNARFIARIYGHEYSQMRDFVEDFSELGKQLAMPVKTYSSGMRARLAFALTFAIEFDCYLIDEVIMVGDHKFQQKCHYELFEKRADRTLILASHSFSMMESYCSEALVLQNGSGRLYSDLKEAERVYASL